jgi:hypothetical protein
LEFSSVALEVDYIGPGAAEGRLTGRPLADRLRGGTTMNRLLKLIGMTLGGWIGWEFGAVISIFTGFLIGMVGTGLGLYASQRLSKRLLP